MDGWPHIVHQYGPLVRRIACRLLGNDADAADCAQEVFLNAIESCRLEEVRNWPGLLRRLTTCRALDMLRQRISRAAKARDVAERTTANRSTPDPVESAGDRELAMRLREALAQLPPRQAEVFYLACVEELGHEQVAEELGITAGNVRVLLHRARAQLREVLTGSNGLGQE